MRLVFVNHAHPDIPHVSGMRLFYFAKAMAKRGHQVVLVTSTHPDQTDSTPSPEAQLKRLRTHDWCTPFHFQVRPAALIALRWIRTNRFPKPIRRALTFWYMAFHGGVFEDWVASCRPHARDLSGLFRPELVWGTFGNTSNLELAQLIARGAGCPWVIDIKDNWSAFIKPGLRSLLALRFRSARGYTANSAHHQTIAAKWLRQRKSSVVYSGVAEAFLQPLVRNANIATRDLVLVGGTYDKAILRKFLEATKAWLLNLKSGELSNVRFIYAGSDSQRVSQMIKQIDFPCRSYIPGYLPLDEFASHCRQAVANCYLWAPFTFHHKLLELLSCARPVIAFPGEAPESKMLAAHSVTAFSACADERSLHAALSKAWDMYGADSTQANSEQWRWSVMAEHLESFFNEVVFEQVA